MDAVTVPFLPVGLWLLATAFSILIVLIIFGIHIYQTQRFKQAGIVFRNLAAELVSRKEQLQIDVTELRNWITNQKDEIARLMSEREEQERLRGELARLQHECATEEDRLIEFRKEAGELENQRYILTQAVDKLSVEIEELKLQRQELEDLQGQIIGARAELDIAKRDMNAARNERPTLSFVKLQNDISNLKLSRDDTTNFLEKSRQTKLNQLG